MSYTVNPSTLLFNDLNEEEATFLEAQVTDLVLHGISTNVWDSAPFVEWSRAISPFPASQALLIMSTAYPQRALLSLLRRMQTLSPQKLT